MTAPVSTRRLDLLPSIDDLRRLCQSLAMLDAILQPEWGYRYYSFNSRWGESEMLASMRNGSGDDYFILFNEAGAIIKGFAHESAMARFAEDGIPLWPGMLDGLPDEFAPFFTEPAVSPEMVSFCIWRRYGDLAWQIGDVDFPEGDDPDGSAEYLTILDGNPHSYLRWSHIYHKRDLPLEPVAEVYGHRPLTREMVAQLNPEVALDDLAEDIAEIGYPVAPGGER